jgi:hypothetical protein
VAAHAVYLGGEFRGAKDRGSAPGRHANQVAIIGNDEEGTNIRREIKNRVVFEVGAIVDCAWRSNQTATAVMRDSRHEPEVRLDIRRSPLEFVLKHACNVAQDVRGEPEGKLSRVDDDAYAVRVRIA